MKKSFQEKQYHAAMIIVQLKFDLNIAIKVERLG